MTRSEVLAMTTAELRRYARRLAKEPYGTVRLEQVRDIRQGPVTGRREGYYRAGMARRLNYAARCRRLGALLDARSMVGAARCERQTCYE